VTPRRAQAIEARIKARSRETNVRARASRLLESAYSRVMNGATPSGVLNRYV
jgi:hypothetical protein